MGWSFTTLVHKFRFPNLLDLHKSCHFSDFSAPRDIPGVGKQRPGTWEGNKWRTAPCCVLLLVTVRGVVFVFHALPPLLVLVVSVCCLPLPACCFVVHHLVRLAIKTCSACV